MKTPADTPDRIRLTVSVPPETLEVFRQMADAAGISVGRCIGDWLTDTSEGAQFVAAKMLEAKRAPRTVMREMQSMAHGLQAEATSVLEQLRRSAAAGAAAGGPRGEAPSSNTGLKSPTPKPEAGGRSVAAAVKRGPVRGGRRR